MRRNGGLRRWCGGRGGNLLHVCVPLDVVRNADYGSLGHVVVSNKRALNLRGPEAVAGHVHHVCVQHHPRHSVSDNTPFNVAPTRLRTIAAALDPVVTIRVA